MAKSPKRSMTMKEWEGSDADEKMDRAAASKRGMSMKDYEDSPADKAADKRAVASHKAGGRKK